MNGSLLSVIVPIRNEPEIENFLLSIYHGLSITISEFEIIIIVGDDDKLTPTIPILPNLRVFTSYGDSLERAILTGFTVAKGDTMIVMDGDGSHDPLDIQKIVRGLDAHDLVVGSRFLKGSNFLQNPFRKFISHVFIIWANMNGSRLSDPMSGFFGLRRELLKRIKFKPFKWKICLEIELKAKPDLIEVPIKFRKRIRGVSKSTIIIGLKIFYDIFMQ
jgi:glycosyltransferase involved in cell wall biosynthesis